MLVCLADDLTGLVELATLCAEAGLDSKIFFQTDIPQRIEEPLVFINLACRHQKGPAAFQIVREVIERIGPSCIEHFYLKVDSVARGPLAWMLQGAQKALDLGSIPLLLTNPATERAVQGGLIFVAGQLLHTTAFAHDPLHPMMHSGVVQILGEEETKLKVALHDEPPGAADVAVLDGSTAEEVTHAAELWKSARAAAGAAPFGLELLKVWCALADSQISVVPPPPFSRMLAVVGSQHPAGQVLADEFCAAGGQILQLGEPADAMTLPLLLRTACGLKANPVQVGQDLVRLARQLIGTLQPEALMIVGGETAQALLSDLGIQTAHPIRQAGSFAELAILDAPTLPDRLWLKPGSYGKPGMLQGVFSGELTSRHS